jgi:hypothetical protein
MSYFNHAYRKSFLGTKPTFNTGGVSVEDGFLLTAGLHTKELAQNAQLGTEVADKKVFGFFTADTYVSVNNAWVTANPGKPLILASTSLLTNDKIGPFHGGYAESNKSKLINPRFVNAFYKSVGADAEQNVVHIGNTNYHTGIVITTPGSGLNNGTSSVAGGLVTTGGSGTGLTIKITVAGNVVTAVSIVNRGKGYKVGDVVTYTPQTGTPATFTLTATCDFEFLCGETYNLQINLWGSPLLRYLNHDAYRRLAAYTGCCATGAAPTAVNSTLVMINWAKQILNDAYLKDFVKPIVYAEDGTKLDTLAAMEAYVATAPAHVAGKTAGLRLEGAYVETKFGKTSFQKSDFYEREIVRIKAQLVDLAGLPCEFEPLCSVEETPGYQGQGYGESVLRNVILDESYLTNHFHDDMRLREINQGNDIYDAVDRNVKYTRYVLVHSVPRVSNPTGVFDNDQYALTIYIPNSFGAATAFETFVANFLAQANNHVTLQSDAHTAYVYDAL